MASVTSSSPQPPPLKSRYSNPYLLAQTKSQSQPQLWPLPRQTVHRSSTLNEHQRNIQIAQESLCKRYSVTSIYDLSSPWRQGHSSFDFEQNSLSKAENRQPVQTGGFSDLSKSIQSTPVVLNETENQNIRATGSESLLPKIKHDRLASPRKSSDRVAPRKSPKVASPRQSSREEFQHGKSKESVRNHKPKGGNEAYKVPVAIKELYAEVHAKIKAGWKPLQTGFQGESFWGCFCSVRCYSFFWSRKTHYRSG